MYIITLFINSYRLKRQKNI